MISGGYVTGIKEMESKLRAIRNGFVDILADAMVEDMKVDVDEAKDRAPVYTGPLGPGKPIPGVLQDSIHYEGPTIEKTSTGSRVTIELTAGGLAGAYAIPQHEDLTLHHEVGQAKYIESVLMESRDERLGRLADLLVPEFVNFVNTRQ